jgi:tight adherence protein B
VNHRLRWALSAQPTLSPVDEPGRLAAGPPAFPAIRVAPMPGPLVLDLVAAVVEGGAPPHSALAAVGAALREVGDPRGGDLLLAASEVGHPGGAAHPAGLPAVDADVDAGADAGNVLAAVQEALFLAARAGLPPTALVRRAAAEERRRQLSAQLRAIRRLEVLLVIPAGLCLLPAFVLLGIVPLVIDLILG